MEKLALYWQFYVWGTKGMISFSLNEKETVYYVSGDKEPKKLEIVESQCDYLTEPVSPRSFSLI